MSRKYETRCWLCGSTDLEPDERGIRCRFCGATYSVIPKPGSDPITMEKDAQAITRSTTPGKSASPSGIMKRRAAKTRLIQQTP